MSVTQSILLAVLTGFSLFFLVCGYLLTTASYWFSKYRHRKYIALVETNFELENDGYQQVVIAAKYRYKALTGLQKRLAVINILLCIIFFGMLVYFKDYPVSVWKIICAVGVVLSVIGAVASIMTVKFLNFQIFRFLETNRYEIIDLGLEKEVFETLRFVDSHPMVTKQRELKSAANMIMNPVETFVDLDGMLDRVMPESLSKNKVAKKVTKKIVAEIIMKISVAVLTLVINYLILKKR